MKNQLGIRVLMLISWCAFVWSGHVFAQKPGSLDPGKYTVFSATGGHMQEGDVFHIDKVDGTKPVFKIRPSDDLKGRWGNGNIQAIDLTANGGPDQEGYCGFVDIDTTVHMGNQYGHDKTHGILVVPVKANQVKIIWSALPIKTKDQGGEKRAENCGNLNKRFHGGMAHASQ